MDCDLDICIISTLRPDILRRTLESLKDMMTDWACIDKRAVVNIDSLPLDSEYGIKDVISVVREYLPKAVINTPPVPSFTRAVRWCWRTAEKKYILHLEDDWEFVKRFSFYKIVEHMELNGFSYLRLPKLRAPELDKIALQPSVFALSAIKSLEPLMTDDLDPEKQLRSWITPSMAPALSQIKIGDYGQGFYCVDIGRGWRARHRIVKTEGKWTQEKQGITA